MKDSTLLLVAAVGAVGLFLLKSKNTGAATAATSPRSATDILNDPGTITGQIGGLLSKIFPQAQAVLPAAQTTVPTGGGGGSTTTIQLGGGASANIPTNWAAIGSAAAGLVSSVANAIGRSQADKVAAATAPNSFDSQFWDTSMAAWGTDWPSRTVGGTYQIATPGGVVDSPIIDTNLMLPDFSGYV